MRRKIGSRGKVNPDASIEKPECEEVRQYILILRSTLHLAWAVLAEITSLPLGTCPCTPSHQILIPTFFIFIFSIFTPTVVSTTICSGSPFLLLRSDLSHLTPSPSSSWWSDAIAAWTTVMFPGELANPAAEPLHRVTGPEFTATDIGSYWYVIRLLGEGDVDPGAEARGLVGRRGGQVEGRDPERGHGEKGAAGAVQRVEGGGGGGGEEEEPDQDERGPEAGEAAAAAAAEPPFVFSAEEGRRGRAVGVARGIVEVGFGRRRVEV
ncbi:hypothetical protein STAS_27930 [Striga asiatica]|uniref:Uncharacterized protein n=1 Tax=Striga asiatica TaxID=4170 RepID=A0A5A7QZS8_STRAF|nr:hypothetical protein STAS_27930 [Striga asiatica]